MSSSILPTARTPKSSRTRRRIRRIRKPRKRKLSGNIRNSKSSSGLSDDSKWMAQALALAEGARGRSAPNPNVGCVIVGARDRVIGGGATASGGRPHAEAVALDQAGKKAKGSRVYVTLEPCAHESARGPACTDLLLRVAPARVVIAVKDPDPRTTGEGIRRLRGAGIEVKVGVGRKAARRSLAGW